MLGISRVFNINMNHYRRIVEDFGFELVGIFREDAKQVMEIRIRQKLGEGIARENCIHLRQEVPYCKILENVVSDTIEEVVVVLCKTLKQEM